MTEQVFADGIGEITVTGTTVRIDLVTLSPTEHDAEGKAKTVFCQRVVMTVESFMNGFDLIDRVARQLIESGAVRRQSPEPDQAAPVRAAPAAGRRSSPNFS